MLMLAVEVEEGQILSFTRGQVTVWNAIQKTTESSFTLDKTKDVSQWDMESNLAVVGILYQLQGW